MDIFLDSLPGGGSHNIVCGHCGREHFCPNSSMIDGPEYNDYLEYAKSLGKRAVIHYEDDFVAAKNIGDIVIVVDCLCNGLEHYANTIWQGRVAIKEYIKKRQNYETEMAERDLMVKILTGAKNG